MKNSLLLVVLLTALLTACNIPSPVEPGIDPSLPPASAPTPTSPGPPGGAGDIIFHNGTLLTMDAHRPTAEAILVRGDRIEVVGSNSEVLALSQPGTAVIDLGGLTLMPGFVDAHSHMFGEDLTFGRDFEPDQQTAIQYGVTTMTDMGMDAPLLAKARAYAETGALRMRMNVYLSYTTNCGDLMGDWWREYTPNTEIARNLTIRGVKIFTDGGSCGPPAVSVPYPSGYGFGDLFFTQEQLNEILADVQAAGWQAGIHALGDRAVEQTQNAIAAALNGQPNTLRHRMDHNGVVRPELMSRYSEIGIVPVIFGAYATCIRTAGSTQFKYLLPESVGTWEWPWRQLLDANPGLPIAWHIDYGPNHNLNAMYILWGFMTRDAISEEDDSRCVAPDWLKGGAIRADEALPIMTINSAYALFMDDDVGSLEPGKLADMIILSADPLHAETDAVKDIQVLMTMIGGKVEHCAAGSEALCPSGTGSSAPPAGAPQAAGPVGPVSASAELAESPASHVLDGDPETIWNSGNDAVQWILLNLGVPQAVTSIRLIVSQYPEGDTVHQIWAGADPNNLALVHEFSGFTRDSDVLEFTPPSPLADVQYIKVLTTSSTSWIAWREIEVR
jgi:hypothetical protein